VADRQSGPVINKFGTQKQKQRFLPQICAGELAFSIGMSEPDAGSDLAATRTRATKIDGGWQINGTKVWTTRAHRNDWLIALCRTSDEPDRHDGFTQMLIDLHGNGVVVRPIPFLDGSESFSEVVLTDAFVPDDLVLGTVGGGWAQNTSELAYERGGPDRWISTFLVVEQFLREYAESLDGAALEMLGTATARWWGLRQLSLSVARSIDDGGTPSGEAALIKEMGTRFEQDVLAAVAGLVDVEPSPDTASLFERLLAEAVLTSPSFTIRGGTIEILRSVVSKGLRS
jgi:3-oxocholest-4-en-26-oyl-CoA dehydrogenase alpha subunit